ncbi:hypothetical protein PBY51_015496 [Eleginops maclovinus]|uniref:Uncharacterized protein n=1 Tax=Eleginops maclovinus TaxID=56733 RepID=A0AAN8AGR9_ELEMC|nr:hypothetical protein PBY51_015496 [Eleginops maclovinus]
MEIKKNPRLGSPPDFPAEFSEENPRVMELVMELRDGGESSSAPKQPNTHTCRQTETLNLTSDLWRCSAEGETLLLLHPGSRR